MDNFYIYRISNIINMKNGFLRKFNGKSYCLILNKTCDLSFLQFSVSSTLNKEDSSFTFLGHALIPRLTKCFFPSLSSLVAYKMNGINGKVYTRLFMACTLSLLFNVYSTLIRRPFSSTSFKHALISQQPKSIFLDEHS